MLRRLYNLIGWVSLVRARAAAYNGDPASLARDNILQHICVKLSSVIFRYKRMGVIGTAHMCKTIFCNF